MANSDLRIAKCGLFVLSFLFVIGSQLYANSGVSFLNLGVGARAQGFGSAYTAIADDVTALHWNPAGLSQLQRKELGAMHAELFSDSHLDFVGYAHPTKKGTFGLGAVYLSQGNIEGRSADRTQSVDFTASDLSVTLGGSRWIRSRTSLGANLKVIQSKIAGYSSTGFAVDAGSLYHLTNLPLTLGFAIQNIGPSMKFMNDSYNLPLTIASGASYRIESSFTISADLKHQPYDSRTSFSAGTEFSPSSMLTLRAGYVTNTVRTSNGNATNNITDGVSDLSGLGLGVGLKLGPSTIDYSFTPAGELGNSQRISVAISF